MTEGRSALWLAVQAAAVLAAGPGLAETAQPAIWAHSCYIYRDVDRNGIFNMGDRPYGDLPLEVTHPDGTASLQSSNFGGFANLTVALGDRENAQIYQPGDHRIAALLPDGWMSTSDKHKQIMTFRAEPKAGGGLVPVETCAPIGIAPVLRVSGRFLPPEVSGYDDISVTATGGDGTTADVEVSDWGRFSFTGERGPWTVTFKDERTGRRHERRIEVDHAPVVIAEFTLGATPLRETGFVELDFDRLVISDSLLEIPSGYGGLDWKNWVATHNRLYKGAGYVNATISSEYVAYNSSGVPASFSRAEPFDFLGVYVAVAWPRGEEEDVIVRAWRGGELVHEDRLRLSHFGPVYFDAGYAGVNRVEFSSGNYERIVLDNLRVRTSP